MTLAKQIVTSALVVLFAASLGHASGFEASGVGVQGRAMGGAFRALANDWTAAYYNPAGFAFIPDNQLGGAWHFQHYRNTVTPNYRFGGVYDNGVYNDVENYNKYEILDYPAGGFVARVPIWGETVIGLSAYQSFDYNVTWRLYSPLTAYNDQVSLPNDQYRNNLDVVVFQLTAAREFQEGKLALGLGLQVLRGDLLFNNTLFRENPLYDREPDAPEVARPYDHITQLSRQDGNGWGFGITGGMIYKLNDKTNLAFTARIPTKIKIKGDAANIYYMPYIRSLILAGNDYALGTVKGLFVSGETVTDSSHFETDLQLPPSVGVGVAFKPIEKLTLTLDAELTFWSKFEGLDFAYTNHYNLNGAAADSTITREFFTADESMKVEWTDAGKLMLGAQYAFKPYWTMMAGATADQSPSRDARFMLPLLMDTGEKYSFRIGSMFHIRQWDLGFATGYTSYPDRQIKVLEDKDGDGTYDNFPGDYQAEQYETVLSVNYRF